MENLPGYPEALEALNKYTSTRAAKLSVFERYVDGTQYDHLDDFFSDKKPLFERAPCIAYPIVKMAIDSHGDLLLGEGRFPSFTVEGMEGEEAEAFENGVSRVVNLSRLKAVSRELFADAQGCGTACAVFSVTGGRLKIQSVFARWCTPQFDPEGAVIALEIRYPYLEEITEHNEQRVVCKLYRRIIDGFRDIEFRPVVVSTDLDPSKEPSWVPNMTVDHGLGFCPVVWYAHMRSCAVVNEYDGKAIHRQLLDEVRALDQTLSQIHRAAIYSGDPQVVEIGVRKGYNAAGKGGRSASMPAANAVPGENGSMYRGADDESAGPGKARKKGPGVIWQYDVPDASKVKVELLTLSGDALKVLDDHQRDLKGKIAESLGVVILDAASLPNESRLSGKALTDLKAPQLARVDTYRDDFGDHFLVPAIGMLLRIAIATNLKIDGLESVTAESTKSTWSWHSPPLHVSWGAYFPMTGEEENFVMTATLPGIGVVYTRRKAVEKLKDILGVKDVDSYMTELEKEAAEAEAKDIRMLDAEAKASAASKPAPAPSKKAA